MSGGETQLETAIGKMVEPLANGHLDIVKQDVIDAVAYYDTKAAKEHHYAPILQQLINGQITTEEAREQIEAITPQRKMQFSKDAAAEAELNRRTGRNTWVSEQLGIAMPDPRNPDPNDALLLHEAAPKILEAILSREIPLSGTKGVTAQNFISEFSSVKSLSLPDGSISNFLDGVADKLNAGQVLDLDEQKQLLSNIITAQTQKAAPDMAQPLNNTSPTHGR